MGPYGGLNSEKIHKIRTATCSTIAYKTKKNNKTVREVKLRKCLNSKVTGLISTLLIEMGFQIYQQLNFSGYEVMKASLQGIFTRLSSIADPAV